MMGEGGGGGGGGKNGVMVARSDYCSTLMNESNTTIIIPTENRT